jgi:transposase
MDVHKNARLTPRGRMVMVNRVLRGETPKAAATASGVSQRTLRRWMERYRIDGETGMMDRSSTPHRSPRAIARGTARRIVTLRQRRHTMPAIAQQLAVSRATVSRVLARAGLSTPASVPVFSSRWFGTTQPTEPRRVTMWLPRWRAIAKPRGCSAHHFRPGHPGQLRHARRC